MKKSKLEITLNEILSKGYNIDKEGNVTRPDGKTIKGSLTDGYLKFSVRTSFTSSFAVRFHKFQAFVKYKRKIFKQGVVVRHKNGIKTDNSYKNILIGSQSQNMLDRPKKERKEHAKIARRNKGVEEHVSELILRDREEGMSYRKLSDKYGIPKSTLMDFVNKQTESS